MSPPIAPICHKSVSDVADPPKMLPGAVGRLGCSLPGPEEQVRRVGRARHLDACTHADLPLCSAAVSHSVTSFAAAGDAAARPRPCRSSGDRAAEHEGASLVLSVGPAPSVHHRSRTEAAGLTDIEPSETALLCQQNFPKMLRSAIALLGRPDVRVGPELRCAY